MSRKVANLNKPVTVVQSQPVVVTQPPQQVVVVQNQYQHQQQQQQVVVVQPQDRHQHQQHVHHVEQPQQVVVVQNQSPRPPPQQQVVVVQNQSPRPPPQQQVVVVVPPNRPQHVHVVEEPQQVVVIQNQSPRPPPQQQVVVVPPQQPQVVVVQNQQPGRNQPPSQPQVVVVPPSQPQQNQPGRGGGGTRGGRGGSQQQEVVVVPPSQPQQNQPGRGGGGTGGGRGGSQQNQPQVVVPPSQPQPNPPGRGGRGGGGGSVTPSQPPVVQPTVPPVPPVTDDWPKLVALQTPANYTSKFKAQLVQLDSMGCVNLDRIKRDTLPNFVLNRCMTMFFCPYEGQMHTMDAQPVNDALLIATLYSSRGYHIMYLCDGTPKEYHTWMDYILSNVKIQLVTYFSGMGEHIKDTSGKEKDGISELLVFFNDSKKKNNQGSKVPGRVGITDMTYSEIVLNQVLQSKKYTNTRIVLIHDCNYGGPSYDTTAPARADLNIVCVGAAKDDQVAVQTNLGGKPNSIFTYTFAQYLTTNRKATFADLQTYTKKTIDSYQEIILTTSQNALLNQPIIPD